MARSPDETRDLLSDTMRSLFLPRVEYERRQHEMLQRLSDTTGKSVKTLVGEAIDRFLESNHQASTAQRRDV